MFADIFRSVNEKDRHRSVAIVGLVEFEIEIVQLRVIIIL